MTAIDPPSNSPSDPSRNDPAPIDRAAVPVRVMLVDDQQLVRSGFALVIASQPDLQIVGQAGNGAEALELLTTRAVDVVLMDVRMPTMDGLAATAAISAMRGDTPKVIILTTFDLDEYVLAAIKAGASGFLLKDAPPEDMLDAIRTVHQGEAVIAPSSTKRLIGHLASVLPDAERTSPAALDALTVREREVLIMIARGLSNTEIAAALFVGQATVKTHVSRVLAKLGTRDRVQAVVLAYETGLIVPGR